MKILVINCGSSSLKFQLIDTSADQIAVDGDKLLAKGEVERIGSSEALVTYEVPGRARDRTGQSIRDHGEAIRAALDRIIRTDGLISDLAEIEGVGHRVAHGGEKLRASVLIDDEVLAEIENCIDLAPLHNPNNIK